MPLEAVVFINKFSFYLLISNIFCNMEEQALFHGLLKIFRPPKDFIPHLSVPQAARSNRKSNTEKKRS